MKSAGAPRLCTTECRHTVVPDGWSYSVNAPPSVVSNPYVHTPFGFDAVEKSVNVSNDAACAAPTVAMSATNNRTGTLRDLPPIRLLLAKSHLSVVRASAGPISRRPTYRGFSYLEQLPLRASVTATAASTGRGRAPPRRSRRPS